MGSSFVSNDSKLLQLTQVLSQVHTEKISYEDSVNSLHSWFSNNLMKTNDSMKNQINDIRNNTQKELHTITSQLQKKVDSTLENINNLQNIVIAEDKFKSLTDLENSITETNEKMSTYIDKLHGSTNEIYTKLIMNDSLKTKIRNILYPIIKNFLDKQEQLKLDIKNEKISTNQYIKKNEELEILNQTIMSEIENIKIKNNELSERNTSLVQNNNALNQTLLKRNKDNLLTLETIANSIKDTQSSFLNLNKLYKTFQTKSINELNSLKKKIQHNIEELNCVKTKNLSMNKDLDEYSKTIAEQKLLINTKDEQLKLITQEVEHLKYSSKILQNNSTDELNKVKQNFTSQEKKKFQQIEDTLKKEFDIILENPTINDIINSLSSLGDIYKSNNLLTSQQSNMEIDIREKNIELERYKQKVDKSNVEIKNLQDELVMKKNIEKDKLELQKVLEKNTYTISTLSEELEIQKISNENLVLDLFEAKRQVTESSELLTSIDKLLNSKTNIESSRKNKNPILNQILNYIGFSEKNLNESINLKSIIKILLDIIDSYQNKSLINVKAIIDLMNSTIINNNKIQDINVISHNIDDLEKSKIYTLLDSLQEISSTKFGRDLWTDIKNSLKLLSSPNNFFSIFNKFVLNNETKDVFSDDNKINNFKSIDQYELRPKCDDNILEGTKLLSNNKLGIINKEVCLSDIDTRCMSKGFHISGNPLKQKSRLKSNIKSITPIQHSVSVSSASEISNPSSCDFVEIVSQASNLCFSEISCQDYNIESNNILSFIDDNSINTESVSNEYEYFLQKSEIYKKNSAVIFSSMFMIISLLERRFEYELQCSQQDKLKIKSLDDDNTKFLKNQLVNIEKYKSLELQIFHISNSFQSSSLQFTEVIAKTIYLNTRIQNELLENVKKLRKDQKIRKESEYGQSKIVSELKNSILQLQDNELSYKSKLSQSHIEVEHLKAEIKLTITNSQNEVFKITQDYEELLNDSTQQSRVKYNEFKEKAKNESRTLKLQVESLENILDKTRLDLQTTCEEKSKLEILNKDMIVKVDILKKNLNDSELKTKFLTETLDSANLNNEKIQSLLNSKEKQNFDLIENIEQKMKNITEIKNEIKLLKQKLYSYSLLLEKKEKIISIKQAKINGIYNLFKDQKEIFHLTMKNISKYIKDIIYTQKEFKLLHKKNINFLFNKLNRVRTDCYQTISELNEQKTMLVNKIYEMEDNYKNRSPRLEDVEMIQELKNKFEVVSSALEQTRSLWDKKTMGAISDVPIHNRLYSNRRGSM